MYLSGYIFVVWGVAINFNHHVSARLPGNSNDVYDKIREEFLRNKRMSRFSKTFGAALDIGERAVKTLLRGAEEIPSAKQSLRDYVKIGDYDDALRDFKKVHPINIQGSFGIDGIKTIGEIGDRTIILTKGKYTRSRNGRITDRVVTIELIRSRYLGSGIERITYINKPNN